MQRTLELVGLTRVSPVIRPVNYEKRLYTNDTIIHLSCATLVIQDSVACRFNSDAKWRQNRVNERLNLSSLPNRILLIINMKIYCKLRSPVCLPWNWCQFHFPVHRSISSIWCALNAQFGTLDCNTNRTYYDLMTALPWQRWMFDFWSKIFTRSLLDNSVSAWVCLSVGVSRNEADWL